MAFNNNSTSTTGDWYNSTITTKPTYIDVTTTTIHPGVYSSGSISSSTINQGVDLSGLFDEDSRREMTPSKDVGSALAEMINKI
jgi:hypothetical protein